MNCPNCGDAYLGRDTVCRRCGRQREITPEEAAAATAAARSVPPPVLEATPVPKLSGKWEPAALPGMLVRSVLAAVLMGGVFHFIARFFNLWWIFPPILGGIVGYQVAKAVEAGRCRNRKLAATLGLAMGLLSYGSWLFFDSMRWRPEIVQILTESVVEQSGAKPDVAKKEAERLLDPWTTFKTYLEMRAETGIRLSSSISSNSGGHTSKGTAYWFMIGAAALLATGVSGAFAAFAASERFCETCKVWYKKRDLYRCSAASADTMLMHVRALDWEGAQALTQRSAGNDTNRCDVVVHACPKCDESQVQVSQTVEKNTTELFHGSLPRGEGARLLNQAK